MKKSVIISLFIFWAVAVSLLIAGFVSYENNKLITVLTGGSGISNTAGDNFSDLRGTAIAGGTLSEAVLTAGEVGQHNSESDCWLIISDGVYDVTTYIYDHPGGAEGIIPFCGKDATEAFQTKGKSNPSDHSQAAYNILASYHIGNIGEKVQPGDGAVAADSGQGVNTSALAAAGSAISQAAPKTSMNPSAETNTTPSVSANETPSNIVLSAAEVQKHNSSSDCWMIVSGKVYDVTTYLPKHPPGANKITPYCGRDGTSAFFGVGAHSGSAESLLASYYIGDVGAEVASGGGSGDTGVSGNDTGGGNTGTGSAGGGNSNNSGNNNGGGSVGNTLDGLFPGAQIVKIKTEDDGRQKLEIIYNGEKYKVKLNAAGLVTDYEKKD